MKYLFKTAKVVYDATDNQYEVYYKNWFFWQYDSCYKINEYNDSKNAKEKAIERAQALLNTVEVWRQTNTFYY